MGSFEEVIVLEELGCGDPGFATAAFHTSILAASIFVAMSANMNEIA